MATEIIMPKAGMAMDEGTVVRWLKSEGDLVNQGEALLEISTDKVNMEVEAEVSGHLIKILIDEGTVVPVFTQIGFIGKRGESVVSLTENMKEKSKVIDLSTKQKEAENTQNETNRSDDYDVIVIGAGPAGYVAAIKASMLGGKVAIVEKIKAGGTCLNRGCIPTKTYVKNVELIENLKKAGQRGIEVVNPDFSLDMEKIVSNKDGVVNTLTGGVEGLLKSHKVDLFYGKADVKPDKTVEISTGDVLSGKNIILATGSAITYFSIPGIESPKILNSDEILDLKEVPQHLVIVGGGVIGCEFAEIFRGYGSEVTVVELADRMIPMFDRELSLALSGTFEKKGITLKTTQKVASFNDTDEGIEVVLESGECILGDKVLLAIGRKPNLSGLEELELKMDRGMIQTNEWMETNLESFYAPGDVNGQIMLAHAAFKMGEIAAVNAMGGRESVNLNAVPSCIYTLPEVASVGLTEDQAREKFDVGVGKFSYGGNGRALASGDYSGFAKVIVDRKYGEILGVHIYGSNASELINEAAVVLQLEVPCDEVANCIHGHPSYSEILMEACADALNECIHLPRK